MAPSIAGRRRLVAASLCLALGLGAPTLAAEVPEEGPATVGSDVGLDALETLEALGQEKGSSAATSSESILEVVEVSARRPLPLEEAPAIVTVVPESQFRLHGLRTLGDVLGYSPGTLLIRGQNAEFVPVVRGLATENGVAVLIDGVPVLDTITGAFPHYEMSLAGFQRVEILRGPGSALYGGNAQAAVINLVSTPPDTIQSSASFGLGYPQVLSGQVGFGVSLGPLGRLAISASATKQEGVEHRIQSDGSMIDGSLAPSVMHQSLVDPENPDYIGARSETSQSASVLVRAITPIGLFLRSSLMYRDVNPLFNPGLGGGKTLSRVTAAGEFNRKDLLAANELSFVKQLGTRLQVILALRYVLNQREQGGAISGPLYYSRDRDNNGQQDAFPAGMRETLEYADKVWTAEAQTNLDLPFGNRAIMGVSLTQSSLDALNYQANFKNAFGQGCFNTFAPTPSGDLEDLTGEQFILPGASRKTAAFFAQNIFSPVSWLDVVGGVRYDNITDNAIVSEKQLDADRLCAMDPFGQCTPVGYADIADGKTYSQLSPRAGVILKPRPGLAVKALYGTAFTPPPIHALNNQTITENAAKIYSNPFLNPMLGRTFELGVSARFLERNVARLSFFDINTEQEVSYDPELGEFQNNAARKIRGGEIELQGERPLVAGTSLFYRGVFSMHQAEAVGGELRGVNANVYPERMGSGWLGATLPRGMRLAVNAIAVSSVTREATDTRPNIDGYALLNATFQLPRFIDEGLTLTVDAKNILDTRYADPLSSLVGIANDYPRGGRTLWATIEYVLR